MATGTLYSVAELEELLAAPDAIVPEVVEPDPAVAPATPAAGMGALGIALLSALAFATSGPFAKCLLEAGWSSGAAVTVRIGGAALALTLPAAIALHGHWRALLDNRGTILGYGFVAIAASQLFYFNAIGHLSVGVALLLEYFSPVLLVLLLWASSRRRPAAATLLGASLATGGLALVVDLFGGIDVDPVGLAWGLAAACAAVAYFLLGARPTQGLPPVALAWSGMVVAALTLGLAGAVHVIPLAWSTADVTLAGQDAPFWVPLAGLALVAGALSYSTGIAAARRLGSTVASFISLVEVVFAICTAYLLLGEVPTSGQLLGGLLILVGVATVKIGERRA